MKKVHKKVKSITDIKDNLQLKFFHCEICNHCFTQKCDLESHVDRKHSEKFECHECKIFFETKHRLGHHINSFHPDTVSEKGMKNLIFQSINKVLKIQRQKKNLNV